MNRTPVDIGQFRNHLSFGAEEDRHLLWEDDWAGVLGTFFLRESVEWLGDEKAFLFTSGPGFDNIHCRQLVEISLHRVCTRLELLGFGEYTELPEELLVAYEDGTESRDAFFVPDLAFQTQNEGGYYYDAVWANTWNRDRHVEPYLRVTANTGTRGHFYRMPCPISRPDKPIRSITLPINELLHIYAVTCVAGQES